jgi:hypothetical protein
MTWFGRRKGDYDPPLVKPEPSNVVQLPKKQLRAPEFLKIPDRLRGPEHIERQPAEEDCDAVEVFKQILAGLEPTETLVIYVVDENDELV